MCDPTIFNSCRLFLFYILCVIIQNKQRYFLTKKHNSMKLLTPIALSKLSKEELFNYIDKLHQTLADYQIIIDVAISKNKHIEH